MPKDTFHLFKLKIPRLSQSPNRSAESPKACPVFIITKTIVPIKHPMRQGEFGTSMFAQHVLQIRAKVLLIKNLNVKTKTDIQKMVRTWKKQYLEGMEASCNSKQTTETFVESIENFGKTSGINVVKFETKESTALTLRHNCGKNFSIFFSSSSGFFMKLSPSTI